MRRVRDLARRDHAVIARIAALHPANTAEADVAALYVAASEQWKDCLRLAQEADTSSYWAQKCRAQANSMMRQAQSALRLLLCMQAARQRLEKNQEARDRAARTEHCAIALMAQALSPQPTPAATAEPPPPASEPQPEPEPVDEPQSDLVAARRGNLPDGAGARQHLLPPARRRLANRRLVLPLPLQEGLGEGAAPARHHAASRDDLAGVSWGRGTQSNRMRASPRQNPHRNPWGKNTRRL